MPGSLVQPLAPPPTPLAPLSHLARPPVSHTRQAETIALLGDKVRARELAEQSGVPILRGSPFMASAAEAEAYRAQHGIALPIIFKARGAPPPTRVSRARGRTTSRALTWRFSRRALAKPKGKCDVPDRITHSCWASVADLSEVAIWDVAQAMSCPGCQVPEGFGHSHLAPLP